MAATRLIALHINKGKTVAQCLRERTDYAQNPEKTAKGDFFAKSDDKDFCSPACEASYEKENEK